MISGIYFKSYRGRKIVKVELNGEKFTVQFSNGEVLTDLNLNELNHVIVTATGR